MLERSLDAPATERREEVREHQHAAPRPLPHRFGGLASSVKLPSFEGC